ncbi:MAG: ComEC/Rec2 family competence protein [Spirochaetia bacterium]|nr:ComEC/Rec2 family competence protein [Spirochaetia bacterium]
MRFIITIAKALVVAIGVMFLCLNVSVSRDVALAFAAVGFLAGLVACFVRNSHVSALLAGLAILACVTGILLLRIALRDLPSEAPTDWFNLTTTGKPIYNRSMLATLQIEKSVTPGIYLANASIQGVAWKKRRQWWFAKSDPRIESQRFPVLLLLKGADYFPGCKIEARVFGRGVPEQLTDSSFHKYAKRQGATSMLRLSARYHVISSSCPIPDLRVRIRQSITETLRKRLNGRELDSAMGFILGQAGYMDKDLKQRATELGILHVFAASGMHLAILYALLLIPAAALLGKKHPLAVCMPLPLCVGYVWLLDFPVSLCRALVFVMLYGLSCVLCRRITSKETILNSAIVLMLWMPWDFATLSSALSFAAVAGILYFTTPALSVVSLRTKIFSLLWKQSVVTICATICTTPILVFALGNHSFMGPLINLVLVPLTDLVLPLLFLATTLDLFGIETIAGFVWLLARPGMIAFVKITESIAPFSFFYKYDSIFALPVCCAALLLALLFWVRNSRELCGQVFRFARATTILLAFMIGPVGALVAGAMRPIAGTFVGQGSDRFEKERKQIGEDLLSIVQHASDDDSHGESDGN